MTKSQLHETICHALLDCTLDDLRVICGLIKRLELGRRKYGPLDLSSPTNMRRDWKMMKAEELADFAVYDLLEAVQDECYASLAVVGDAE